MSPRSRLVPRCVYKPAQGRRCPHPGVGNPPMCFQHFAVAQFDDGEADEGARGQPVADIVDAVLDHPKVQNIFSAILQRMDHGIRRAERPEDSPHYRGPDAAYDAEWPPRPRQQQRRRQQQQQQQRRRRPGRPKPPESTEDPRMVLGFGPQVRLTTALIKDRQRRMAAMVHPDVGGSEEAMRRVNIAADALLSQLR